MEEDKTIDNWSLNRKEYPFVYRGMTVEAYNEEMAYYLTQSIDDIKSEKYTPLWKQRNERH